MLLGFGSEVNGIAVFRDVIELAREFAEPVCPQYPRIVTPVSGSLSRFLLSVMRVCFEELLDLAVHSEQHRDPNLLVGSLPGLDTEAEIG